MARIIESLPEEERRTPALTSPRLAVEALASYLRNTSIEAIGKDGKEQS